MSLDRKVTEMQSSNAKNQNNEFKGSPSDDYGNKITNQEPKSSDQFSLNRSAAIFFIAFFFVILVTVSLFNPNVFKLDLATTELINQSLNAIIVLTVPFILGSIGAVARILLSDVRTDQSGVLIISSGLMAAFSWIGIKSGVLLAIVAPHLGKQGIPEGNITDADSNFYTMALVAILVGMFASNLYIFINQRVEHLTDKKAKSTVKNDEGEKEL